jgi:NAD+ kinase
LLKTVGLVARYDKKKAVKLAETLADHLTTQGINVYAEETLVDKTHIKTTPIPLKQMRTDLIITIGGDGTILRTCITIPKPEPPILAINMGVRGFLTEIEPKDALKAVDKILNGNYKTEKYTKLKITADELNFPDALNEVVISPDEPAKLLYARILKDKQTILDCQSDGIMVATQTGSTGYSLSAGGPVLDPDTNAFVITPIIPLSIFHPIVIPNNTEITIEVIKSRRTQILVDGHYRQIATTKLPHIKITRSKNETQFIRFTNNFYDRLRNRLYFKGMRRKP